MGLREKSTAAVEKRRKARREREGGKRKREKERRIDRQTKISSQIFRSKSKNKLILFQSEFLTEQLRMMQSVMNQKVV